jgi:hypothetical protein
MTPYEATGYLCAECGWPVWGSADLGAERHRTAFGHDPVPPLTRAQLLERLEVERHQPVPRRPEAPISRPRTDPPEVVAERRRQLAEIPADDPEEAEPGE